MAKLKGSPTPPPVTTEGAAPTWMPEVDDGAAKRLLPRLEPRAPALLTVHPERWTVMQGMVVPQCGSLKLQAGINRVTTTDGGNGNGKLLLRDATSHLEEKGWQVLPADVDGASYITQVSPKTFLTRWQKAFAGSDHIEVDEVGYATWLRKLITEGKINAPKSYVLEAMASKLRKQVEEVSDRVATTPSLRPLLARYESDLAAVERELTGTKREPANTASTLLDDLVSHE